MSSLDATTRALTARPIERTWLGRTWLSVLMLIGSILVIGVGSEANPVEAAPLGGNLVPITPARLLETRSGTDAFTSDGQYLGGGKIPNRGVIAVQIAGREGIAADAEAVALNVTVAEPDAPGHITAYPCESANDPYPLASNLNYLAGTTIPNAVFTKLGDTGMVCFHSWVPAHLIVDATGYVPPDGAPVPVDPKRYLETRDVPDEKSFDGEAMQRRRVRANETVEFVVADRGDVPADATAVILNVTAVMPSGAGHLTVFPCGIDLPATSSLNYVAGITRPNQVIATIGDGGKVCINTVTETDIIADVNGYMTPGGGRDVIEPVRCVDTRIGPEYRTFDGLFQGDGKVQADTVYEVVIGGRCHVPEIATAAYLNVTAVNAEAPGHLTLYPCGEDKPPTSNVNYMPGEASPNGVVAKIGLSGEGKVCVYSHATTDVIIDVNGYVPPQGPNFTDIAHGGGFGCGIEGDDGGLICWGRNLYGSLPGVEGPESMPYRPAGLTSGIVDISLKDYRGCVVRDDGTAACWGRGRFGQLGDGQPYDNDTFVEVPTTVVGTSGSGALRDLVQIRTAEDHTCAVDADGTAYCWGNDRYGSLGIAGGSGNDDTSTPVEVTVIPAGRSVVEIAPGNSSTCALLDDTSVLCWGFAADGVYSYLGDGDGQNGGVVMLDAAATTPLTDVVDIDGGDARYCAARSDGSAVCWGNNTHGQLGSGDTAEYSYAVPVQGVSDVVQVSAGAKNSCALNGSGTSMCWGAWRWWGGDIPDDEAPEWWTVPWDGPLTDLDTESDWTGCWLTAEGFAVCAGWNTELQSGYPTESGGGQRVPGYVYTWTAT